MQGIHFRNMPVVRLGVLVPSVNAIIEPDMYKMAPDGVTVHFERLVGPSADRDPFSDREALARRFRQTGEYAVKAAQVLAIIEPKVIAFGFTSGSFYFGIDYDKDLIKNIEASTNIRAITTSTAAVTALDELGLKRICLITPYPEHVTAKAREFLEASGFEVPVAEHLDISPVDLHEQPPEVAYELAVAAYRKGCDGVFCSCTAFRTVEIIDRVERELGVPMVSANQATMWLLLREAGVRKPIAGYGELLKHL
ncbi:MAG: aspartate/glutamate racemase family protein [Chloroflexi bacterium]|nr:aspartate/glutamate racemase family protein [Chloroflexota bacterium]